MPSGKKLRKTSFYASVVTGYETHAAFRGLKYTKEDIYVFRFHYIYHRTARSALTHRYLSSGFF